MRQWQSMLASVHHKLECIGRRGFYTVVHRGFVAHFLDVVGRALEVEDYWCREFVGRKCTICIDVPRAKFVTGTHIRVDRRLMVRVYVSGAGVSVSRSNACRME